MATNKPTNVGKILKTTPIPSFAPSKKISKTYFLSITPYKTIIIIINGIAILEKNSINFIFIPASINPKSYF